MMANITYPLGGLALLEKIEKSYGLFATLFQGIGGRSNIFLPTVKLHVYNKLAHSVSVNQLRETYPTELFAQLGMDSVPGTRSLYRPLERIGEFFPLIHSRYQQILKEHDLIDAKQILDFSSTYFEGEHAELSEFGYSRDNRPDKVQITFGISTGINGIPTALTIQKGNTQDKKHMKTMLKIVSKIISVDSLLIFDTGANTKKNKEEIRRKGYQYLTLKAKKVNPYKSLIQYFNDHLTSVESFEINKRHYYGLKKPEKHEVLYIFFCPELYETHMKSKEKKFLREKEKGNKLLKKRKLPQYPSDSGWVTLVPHLQDTLFDIDNPYIKGIEGFFILESSVDEDPEKILRLYKQRDKAEKFFRNLKEGIELRPLRHWKTESIIGLVFLCFLANVIIHLSQLKNQNVTGSKKKNVKLLKKSLLNLSLTIVYPERGFKCSILSNVSPQILGIIGDFVWKYKDKTLELRW